MTWVKIYREWLEGKRKWLRVSGRIELLRVQVTEIQEKSILVRIKLPQGSNNRESAVVVVIIVIVIVVIVIVIVVVVIVIVIVIVIIIIIIIIIIIKGYILIM